MLKDDEQPETAEGVKAANVANYIVQRLAAEGISHCFGVAGDYLFPICDAVDGSKTIKWIGCLNELNASYAADAYARIRGAAMLATTYGVWELSALNGVMRAKAERSLVFHVVGMPSYQHRRVHKIAHHTLGDGVFANFVEISAAGGAATRSSIRTTVSSKWSASSRRHAATTSRPISPCRRISRCRPYRRAREGLAPVTGSSSDKITMAALYPRYAAFFRAGDTVVLETGSTSTGLPPAMLPDGVRVEAQVLWGSIGWATPAAFGIALADPGRRTILITGEGSHQLTASEIGAMGRFGTNAIVFVLNNEGYLIERALEENPNWTYNDLAPWNYAELPKTLGCPGWFTARVTTLGELDQAMNAARASNSGAYIEIIAGKMDMPPLLAFAHGRLKAMYGETP